jgi:hypothetical protein
LRQPSARDEDVNLTRDRCQPGAPYLHAQYLRVKRRRGHKKAIVAVAHSIIVAAYYILRDERPTRSSAPTTSCAARIPSALPIV